MRGRIGERIMYETEKADIYINSMGKMSDHLKKQAYKFAYILAEKAIDKAQTDAEFKEVDLLLIRLSKIKPFLK
jgi:hypothetical protein